ncbi:FG-GAP-like repeat-containing protein [Pirellulales bacterium]|nr:FG-GAP-like repeat-containing protein [Pirellulales bacterium]
MTHLIKRMYPSSHRRRDATRQHDPLTRQSREAGFELLEQRILLASDFGDAPFPYPTTLAESGAEHVIVPGGPQLGIAVDSEPNGGHSPEADSDGSDDDGVAFGTIQVGAVTATVSVSVVGIAAKLDAWIDFTGDGNWGGPGEQIFASRSVDLGDNLLAFSVPNFVFQGTTYARFRLSTAGGLGVVGQAADGEVEDYQVDVTGPVAVTGVFGPPQELGSGFASFRNSVADIDSDGDVDFLGIAGSPSTIKWHENQGNNVYTEQSVSNSGSRYQVIAADIDGDGDMDVVAAGSVIDWFENNGSQSFTRHLIDSSVREARTAYVADMEGDGDLDILTADSSERRFLWYENDGDQDFTRQTILATRDETRSIAAADIDGDGDLDVLTAHFDDNRIVWHRNDGDLQYSPYTVSNNVEGPESVFTADIDGDGDLDVLSASTGDDKVAWHENLGSSFVTRVLSTSLNNPRYVAATDLDGDGDLDVISSGANSAAWFKNDGNQSFTAQTIRTPIAGLRLVQLADVDGDGDLDAITSSSADLKLAWQENLNLLYDFTSPSFSVVETNANSIVNDVVLTRTGNIDVASSVDVVLTADTASSGSDFVAGPITVTFNIGESAKPVPIEVVGDTIAENDETLNLSMANFSTGGGFGNTQPTAQVLIEDNDLPFGEFGDAPTPYPTTRAEGGARHVASGPMLGATRDVEADGAHSVAADADGTDEDGVTFGVIQVGALDATVTVNVQNAPGRLDAWIDFNRDGNWGGTEEQIVDSRDVVIGDNQFAFDVPSYAAAGTTYARFRISTAGSLAVSGVSLDGEVEDYEVPIVGPSASSRLFGSQNHISTEADGARSVFAADVDGDGDLDVLSASRQDDKVAWYENDGGQDFQLHIISGVAYGASSVSAADLDGDGDLDVLSTSPGAVTWHQNNGSQVFSAHTISTTASGSTAVTAADIDGDGDLDVVAGGTDWYENVGSENFVPHTVFDSYATSVFAADADGDGDIDFLRAVPFFREVAWYINDGTQQFTRQSVAVTAHAPEAAFPVDIDGDGDLDVLSVVPRDDLVAWHENDGSENFITHTISTTAAGASSVFGADLDGDGDVDVVSASADDDKIAWYENDGNEGFTAYVVNQADLDGESSGIDGDANGASSVYAADVDGDGDLDLLTASERDDKIAWHENYNRLYDFTAPEYGVAEGNANNTSNLITLTRSGLIDIATSVEVVPIAGAANSGSDFAPGPIAVQFDVGEATKPVPLAIFGDNVPENNESVHLLLTSFSHGGGPGAEQPETTLRILDDDFTLGDFGDAAMPQATVLAENGARHLAAGPTLGAARDVESDGTPSPQSDSDGVDEDGVTIGPLRVGALDASVTINVQGGSAKLDAWIDFNRDGSWNGIGELVFDSRVVLAGDNHLTMDVPSYAIAGSTFARFRLSTSGELSPTGLAVDGEVEDYEVTILSQAETAGVFGSHNLITSDVGEGMDVYAADVDGDGDMDVLSASFRDDKIAWHENDGSENFIAHNVNTPDPDGSEGDPDGNANGARSVFAADVDGDGDIDVLSASSLDHKIAWYENDGNQNFVARVITTTAFGAYSVLAADVDGDGDTDVISASTSNDTIAWYENDGDENFTTRLITTRALLASGVFAADIDGDGDLDVLSVYDFDHIAWYENKGSQGFETHTVTTAGSSTRGAFAADVDGDGDVDLLSASYSDDEIAWYENDGNQNFTKRTISAASDYAQRVFAADVDGDGDLDVLASGSDIEWFENDGAQNFTRRTIRDTYRDRHMLFYADVDGDGDLDVLSAYAEFIGNNHGVTWHENLAVSADFDDDDHVGGRDFLAWQRGFGTTAPNASPVDGDADGDQDVDDFDLEIWQRQFDSAIGDSSDFDRDGQISGSDFLAWQRGLGTIGAANADGDADGDQDVDAADLGAWESQYGSDAYPVASAVFTSANSKLPAVDLVETASTRSDSEVSRARQPRSQTPNVISPSTAESIGTLARASSEWLNVTDLSHSIETNKNAVPDTKLPKDEVFAEYFSEDLRYELRSRRSFQWGADGLHREDAEKSKFARQRTAEDRSKWEDAVAAMLENSVE